MKTTKKLLAALLALVMALALAAPAWADGTGDDNSGDGDTNSVTYSITINGAVKGETYNAYKIFDATAAKDSDGKVIAYSYTISETSTWWSDILTYMGAATADPTTGVYTGAGLTLTPSAANRAVYVVEAKVPAEGEGTSDGKFNVAAFAAFLNGKTSGKSAVASATAEAAETNGNVSATIDVSGTGAGYYFVDTSLGSLCSLDTVVGADQVIYEKNSTPTIKKYVLEDDNNFNHTANTTEQWKSYTTGSTSYAVLDVTDTVYYKLVVNTGTNNNGDGTGVDGDYVITDTFPQGIDINSTASGEKTTYPVTVKTNTGTDGAEKTWTESDYTVSYDSTNRKLTITLLSTGELGKLAQDTNITITYDASMTAEETGGVSGVNIGKDKNNINSVTLTYKQQTSTSTADVRTYELVPTTDSTLAFKKVDGTTNAALAGVKFVLSRTVNNATQYAVVAGGYLTGWTANLSGDDESKTYATELETGSDGSFNVKGLDAGTYILTETETLPGYNLLDDTITVTIAAEGDVTYKLTKAEGSAAGTIIIKNNTGTELPSTGGTGTTVFYVVGGVLVAAAIVLLITRKRMNSAD